jgi:hypothetical protein
MPATHGMPKPVATPAFQKKCRSATLESGESSMWRVPLARHPSHVAYKKGKRYDVSRLKSF